MRKILFILIILPIVTLAQYTDTVYINPDAASGGDGSYFHPYKGWKEYSSLSNIPLSNNTCYLMKAGTIDSMNQMILTTVSNVKISSYDVGKKPIYHRVGTDTKAVRFNDCENIIIDNIRIEGDTNSVGRGISNTLLTVDGGNNILINKVDIVYSGYMGMDLLCDSLTIDSCLIRRIDIDGIYISGSTIKTPLEISYCTIDSVNMRWEYYTTDDDAPGDGIQINLGDDSLVYYIHHNTIDRSSTGYKFCFISTGECYGIIEHNTFITPLDRNSQGGTGLYLGSGGDSSIIVRYNEFYHGELNAISNHSRYNYVYGNIFYGFTNDEWTIDYANTYPLYVYNNVFYNCTNGIRASGGIIKNNIFYSVNNAISLATNVEYNCFYSTPQEGNNYVIDNPQFINVIDTNFHLQASSPCIDAGVDVGLRVDADGTTLPQGKGYDIGVYEYTERASTENSNNILINNGTLIIDNRGTIIVK